MFEEAKKRARFFIETLDKKYTECQRVIEKYCYDNKILIDPPDNTGRAEVVKLYSTRPFEISKALADHLFSAFKGHIYMKTVLKNEELFIEYFCRKVAEIHLIPHYADVDFSELIIPDEGKYIPRSLLLIDLFHKLYLPEMKDLHTHLEKRTDEMMLSIKATKIKLDNYHGFLTKLRRKILPYAQKVGLVIIGSWAIGDFSERLQLISQMNIDIDFAAITGALKDERVILSKREQRLHLFSDFRIRRHTIYVELSDKKSVPLVDLFNCGLFELVPFTSVMKIGSYVDTINHFRVGTYPVLMRFMLIDLWILELVHRMKKINDVLYNKRKAEIMSRMISVFEQKNNTISDYIGVYRDYNVEKRIYNDENKKIAFPYIPHSSISDSMSSPELSSSKLTSLSS